MQSLKQEIATIAAKASPAMASAGYSWLTLSEVAALFAIIYSSAMLLMAAHKHYYFVKEQKRKMGK